MKPEEMIRIILIVLLSSVFIVVFYFTYSQSVEKEVIQQQFATTINNMTNDFTQFIPAEYSNELSQIASESPGSVEYVNKVDQFLTSLGIPSEYFGMINQFILDARSGANGDFATSANGDVIQQNNILIGKTKKFVTIFAICVLLLLIFIIKSYKIPSSEIKTIVRDDLIVLAFIALTEYLYLTYVIAKCVYVDENTIKYAIVNTIAKNINQ